MKLSIIIPVYDERPYIRRCLDSVKASEEVEVIVIDDESLDGSYEIEQTYADRFEIIRYEHVGVSAARNSGIYKSKGEYITFLDSDDALASDGVQTLLDVIDSHPDSDIIQMNHKRCSGGICRIEQKFSAKNGYYPVNNLPPKWAPVWNKIYRKEFIENNRIRFPEGQQFDEDRRFNIQCLKHAGGFQMDDTIGHQLDLDLQITKGRTHTLWSGEASLDAITMYAGCFEEVLQFLDGVEDEPCVGDGSQPIFVLFLFLFHSF